MKREHLLRATNNPSKSRRLANPAILHTQLKFMYLIIEYILLEFYTFNLCLFLNVSDRS